MKTDSQRGAKVGQLLPPLTEAGERFMWEWHLSRGAMCQRRRASFPVLIGDQPAGLRCSAVRHACPSHTAALRSVTLGCRSNADDALWLFVSCHADYFAHWNPTEGSSVGERKSHLWLLHPPGHRPRPTNRAFILRGDFFCGADPSALQRQQMPDASDWM